MKKIGNIILLLNSKVKKASAIQKKMFVYYARIMPLILYKDLSPAKTTPLVQSDLTLVFQIFFSNMPTKANENRLFGYLCMTTKTEKIYIFKKIIVNDGIELDLPDIGRKITQCVPDSHQTLKQVKLCNKCNTINTQSVINKCNKCNTINVISVIQ